jgi:hypothetical protein
MFAWSVKWGWLAGLGVVFDNLNALSKTQLSTASKMLGGGVKC